ncbi:MAG: secondary thiamine-phosphate synthase enzyme YjbQ [Nitrososphaeria archaeon]
MKVHKASFNFKTSPGISFINLSNNIQNVAEESGVENGILLAFAPHATGAMIINENDRHLLEDIRRFLEQLVPQDKSYRHPENAPSHILSSLLTPSLMIPIAQGRLQLGTWQSIFWIEVEPWPRTRTVYVTIIGE